MTRDPVVLTEAEVEALVNTASRSSASGLRTRALIAVLYGAGLRISEALALYPGDVDTDACTVRVRNGKGGKPRHVGIMPRWCDTLDLWMVHRARLGLNGRHPIFAVYTRGRTGGGLGDGEHDVNFGRAMSAQAVRASLKRLAVRADLGKNVHPHAFRHSLADHMRRAGRDPEIIRKQLGHTDLRITTRYLDHLSPLDLVEALDWHT